jgi:hypothetical protein
LQKNSGPVHIFFVYFYKQFPFVLALFSFFLVSAHSKKFPDVLRKKKFWTLFDQIFPRGNQIEMNEEEFDEDL